MPMKIDDNFWDGEREKLYEVIFPKIRDAAVDAAKDAAGEMNLGASWELVNKAAQDWAKDYSAKLVKDVTETTRNNTRQAIEAWAESGKPLNDLVKSLKPIYEDAYRAEMIARTEVTRAYHEGNVKAWKASGVVDGFTFIATQGELSCPFCAENHLKDFPLEDTENAPPLHPHCICYSKPKVKNTD